MERDPIIRVALDGNSFFVKTQPVFQYDHGLTQYLTGYDASGYQVHFSNEDLAQAVNIMVTSDESGFWVPIPDSLLLLGKDITAFVYKEDDESGIAVKQILVPLVERPRPTTLTFDSPEVGPVNQLAAELTRLTEEVNNTIDRTENLVNMEFAVEVAPGDEPTITETDLGDGNVRLTFGLVPGKQGEPGAVQTVNGISPDENGNVQISAGTGSVQTVNGISPDDSGNIQLDASNVGARPDTWIPTPSEIGALASDGTAANAEKLGDIAAEEYVLRSEMGESGVQSVNGILPDENGNVEIKTSGGSVTSVNEVEPDDAGNIALTGENLPVSIADERTTAAAILQHDNTIHSLTADEFAALTTEELAALHAQGVRQLLVESSAD